MIPRVDPYSAIHKVLRCFLADASRALGNADFADDDASRAAVAFVRERLAFIKEHAQHEDACVQPELEKRIPAQAKVIAADHAHHEAALAVVEAGLAEIEATTGAARLARAASLYREMNRFVASYLEHLDREETEVLSAVWEHFDDAEILAMRGRIQAAIPPPRFAEWLRHWLPVLNPTELAGMLAGMKASAPPEAFGRITGLARDVLGAEAWGKIAARAGL